MAHRYREAQALLYLVNRQALWTAMVSNEMTETDGGGVDTLAGPEATLI